MATVIIEKLTDSLDERIGSDVENVTFFDPFTGEKMEIQLGAANRKHLENHMERLRKYVDAAEVVEAPKPARKVASKASGEIALIREWAQKNGYQVGDRGRIKAEIKEAYAAAQQEAVTDKVMGPVDAPQRDADEQDAAVDIDDLLAEIELDIENEKN